MKILLSFSLQIYLFFWSVFVSAQPLPNRYQADVFDNWIETTGVLFSTDVPQPIPGGGFYEWVTGYPLNVDEFDTTDEDLYMNILEPEGDTLSQRPLVIICFGGGFLAGSKDHWSMRLLAEGLARRGFVTALIDYRLGMNIFDSDLAQRAVYRGLQDGRSAVRFFRADAASTNTYRIDPNQIFIGGHSSGAFIAVHNAYLDKESERPISTYVWTQENTNDCPDLGCLDCVGDNQEYSGAANGIFSLAGAIGFTDFMESADDPTVVMFHSSDDGTVPYESGQPFSDLLWLVVGDDLPDVYGSSSMADRADEIGLDYELHSYTDRGHGVHEDDPNLYSDIIPGIEDWFYVDRLKPAAVTVSGDNVVCSDELLAHYMTDQISHGYYDWQVTSGEIVSGDHASVDIEVEWDDDLLMSSVTLVPYSKWRARGDTVSLDVEFMPSYDMSWIGTNGVWTDIASWSVAKVPDQCDDVSLPGQSAQYKVTLPELLQSEIRTLEVHQNVELRLLEGATLRVKTGTGY